MQIASLTVPQLEQRFFLEEAPYWWAYNGTRSKELLGKFREGEGYASDEERILDAWMQLEELLSTIPYGRARIVLKTSPSANVANSPTLTVQWGQAPDRTGGTRSAIGSTIGPAAAPDNMLLYMLEMQKEANARESQSREAAHAREMENMRALLETKFHAESLEAEIEGMSAPGMSQELIREGMGMVKAIFAQPRLPAAPAALGTLGQGSGETIDAPLAPPTTDAEGNKPGERRFSVDMALQHISVVRKNLPEYHVNDILQALALFTSQQPDMARGMVGQLMSMVSNEG